ncbi:DUF2878 domain-containing protein [Vibrio viridaestus]|uniref:DUF2878 domain-containing protein n=1 Tax=Vibrio viridaestus TaxID=2487322 RepID=A0A3N9TDR7_9VIBR|nr:DUF2878 domain-containing protein [Vibrio viridaestus]RQW61984.1 DUF2878 domain-containing protein [Vibrio viridaestus]
MLWPLYLSILFQSIWFVLILGTSEVEWPVLPIVVIVYIVSFLRHKHITTRALFIGCMGCMLDIANTQFGLFLFDENGLLVPLWLIELWFCFSIYISFLMVKFISWNQFLLLLAGGIGGMLSYYAAYRIGVVEFTQSLHLTLVILFLEWMAVMFLIRKCHAEN